MGVIGSGLSPIRRTTLGVVIAAFCGGTALETGSGPPCKAAEARGAGVHVTVGGN